MSEYITVKHLKDLCEKQIEKGNGDKQILISADEEGNTFNPLMFSFVDDAKEMRDLLSQSYTYKQIELAVKEFIILG